MGAFGDLLKTAISVSGLKGASIAGHINYDPSYISKWINSDILPSDKTIKNICKDLGDYFAENCSEKELQDLSREMGIAPPADKEIYKLFYAAYLSDRKNKKFTEESGSAIPLRPFAAGRKQFLFNSLSEYRKKADTLNMIIMGDLLYCDIEDIVFLMDLKTHINSLGFVNGKIDILISELSITDYKDARNMVAMLNFLMLPCTVKTNVYRSKITHTGIMFIIEEVLLYTMQCNSSIHWLFETRELDSERIHEIFQTVKTELLPIAREIFVKQHPCAMTNPENFEHIFSTRKEWMLLGSMDVLFLPLNMLEKLISMDQSMPAEIKSCWLKKHKINLEYIAGGRQTRCIVYREALEKLIYNGTMRMFDKEIILPISMRTAYIQNIIKNLEQNTALEILIVEDYLVDEIKHKPLPNAFLSKGNAYFLTFPVNGLSEYCFIQDLKFKAALRKMFEQLWKGKNIPLLDARDVMGEYLDLCHDITYL